MAGKTWRRKIPFAYTPIPNTLFEWQPHLSPAAFAVQSAIFRLTWGYGKTSDTIAISQLAEITGIPRRTIDLALKELRDAGLLSVTGPSRHPKIMEPKTTRFLDAGNAPIALATGAGSAIPCVTVAHGMRTSKERKKLEIVK